LIFLKYCGILFSQKCLCLGAEAGFGVEAPRIMAAQIEGDRCLIFVEANLDYFQEGPQCQMIRTEKTWRQQPPSSKKTGRKDWRPSDGILRAN
jgi:hypothetical protein